jgi:DNA-binding CsgD family transcriptional regulator
MALRAHRRIEDFAADIGNTRSFRRLSVICASHFRALGATMMSYHHLPPLGAVDYHPTIMIATYGFPENWVARYVSEKYFDVDPIPRHARFVTEPFWWREAASFPGLSKAEIAFLDYLTQAELGDGLAVPVFGPLARNGYVGLGFGKSPPALSHHDIIRIQWACQLGHLRYCHLLGVDTTNADTLSAREREVVDWVARGKSNAVIGEILGISTSTVDTHLRRVYSKLGVSDRVTAALRALSMGELS